MGRGTEERERGEVRVRMSEREREWQNKDEGNEKKRVRGGK